MLPLLLVLIFAPGCTGREDAPERPARLPDARTEVAGTAWGEDVVVAGGYLRDGTSSRRVDIWTGARLPDAHPRNVWEALPDLPEPRNHASLAVARDRLWVVGGNAPDRATGAVWSLGRAETSWRREPGLAQPRAAAGLLALGDRLVAFGGAEQGRALRSTEILDPGARAWRAGPDLAVAREHLAAAAYDGRAYAIAGRVGGLAGNLRVVESFGIADGRWRREPDLVHSRGGTSAASTPGGPCVAGGEEPDGTIGSVECLRAGVWRVAAQLPEARHGLAVVAVRTTLHVIAGGPRPGLYVSDRHDLVSVSP